MYHNQLNYFITWSIWLFVDVNRWVCVTMVIGMEWFITESNRQNGSLKHEIDVHTITIQRYHSIIVYSSERPSYCMNEKSKTCS